MYISITECIWGLFLALFWYWLNINWDATRWLPFIENSLYRILNLLNYWCRCTFHFRSWSLVFLGASGSSPPPNFFSVWVCAGESCIRQEVVLLQVSTDQLSLRHPGAGSKCRVRFLGFLFCGKEAGFYFGSPQALSRQPPLLLIPFWGSGCCWGLAAGFYGARSSGLGSESWFCSLLAVWS